jgi:predicted DNA-binding antitoxin AbrB/MazE fold protein
MAITIEAVYEDGVLKPVRPLPFVEHEKVEVTVSSSSSWVQETAGILGWKGTSEELAAFVLGQSAPALEAESWHRANAF